MGTNQSTPSTHAGTTSQAQSSLDCQRPAGNVTENEFLQVSSEVLTRIQALKDFAPSVTEFAWLKVNLKLGGKDAHARACKLLGHFMQMHPDKVANSDMWYGQLDDVVEVASLLGNRDVLKHAVACSDFIRKTQEHNVVAVDRGQFDRIVGETQEDNNDSKQQALAAVAVALPDPWTECAICLNHLEPHEKALRCCGEGGRPHWFHADCMMNWSKSSRTESDGVTCPTCRAQVNLHKEEPASRPLNAGLRPIVTTCVATAAAFDPVEFFKADASAYKLIQDAGYSFQRKTVGKQHAVPSQAKLEEIKHKCVDELGKCSSITMAVQSKSSVNVEKRFAEIISREFDLERFHKCDAANGGLSRADIYTYLPLILDALKTNVKPKHTVLKSLYTVFADFRQIFGCLCNPVREYFPIFEAIWDLLQNMSKAPGPLQVIRDISVSLMWTLCAVVLDVLAFVVDVCGSLFAKVMTLLIAGAAGGPIGFLIGVGIVTVMALVGLLDSSYFYERAGRCRVFALRRVDRE
eukprot:TRINITY_DN76752_c0_g1_i1.p1 TRINITY_DN76752_c0_g1~~TRINITY_DN76752_c0_g1_i1.p1  ORF type:complete len:542 (-),score=85.39 TRINITY_DN76752_c0_g1_i1:247-1809(-)